jgi:hypothetical protein
VLHGRTGVGPRLARGSHKRNLVIRRAIPKRNRVIRRAIPHDNHTPALASVSRCQPPAPGEPRSSRRTLTSGLPSPDASAGARMPGAWTSSAAGVWRLELGDARLPAPKEEVPRVREMTPCARESHGYQDLARRCCFCRIARSGAISDRAPPGACSSFTVIVVGTSAWTAPCMRRRYSRAVLWCGAAWVTALREWNYRRRTHGVVGWAGSYGAMNPACRAIADALAVPVGIPSSS